MFICPYIQEHESKVMTNNVTNKNVVSKVIQNLKAMYNYISTYHPLTLLVAYNSHTQAFMVASLPTTFFHIFCSTSFVLS